MFVFQIFSMKGLLIVLCNFFLVSCQSNVPVAQMTDTMLAGKNDAPVMTADSIPAKQDSNLLATRVPDTIRMIYLTFDDGPLIGTDNVIEVLNQLGLPATMFMVGKHTQADGEMRQAFLTAYNDPLLQVSSHSYSHANSKYKLFYQNPKGVLADFDKNNNLLQLTNKDGRLPGRNTWRVGNRKRNDPSARSQEAADLLQQNGYSLFGWDIEWQHHGNAEPTQSVAQLLQMIHYAINDSSRCFTPYKLVLLSHDQMFARKENKEKLIALLTALKSKGYQFGLIKNYPF